MWVVVLMEDNIRRLARYLNERELIRQAKEAGEPWPWTEDPILQSYRFTNVFREHDKTTRHFKTQFYDKRREAPHAEIFLNCALFRYFGTTYFADQAGWQTSWKPEYLKWLCMQLTMERKSPPIFTSAYVITNGGISAPKYEVVIDHYLQELFLCLSLLVEGAQHTQSWESVFHVMQVIKGFGGTGFMAKEVLQDVMLTPVLENATDKYTWTPIGPGARRGLARVLHSSSNAHVPPSHRLPALNGILAQLKPHLSKRITKHRQYGLHDLQFALCEFDKYERARLGEGRPKRSYTPSND